LNGFGFLPLRIFHQVTEALLCHVPSFWGNSGYVFGSMVALTLWLVEDVVLIELF
jgi:hypothetical protein